MTTPLSNAAAASQPLQCAKPSRERRPKDVLSGIGAGVRAKERLYRDIQVFVEPPDFRISDDSRCLSSFRGAWPACCGKGVVEARARVVIWFRLAWSHGLD